MKHHCLELGPGSGGCVCVAGGALVDCGFPGMLVFSPPDLDFILNLIFML